MRSHIFRLVGILVVVLAFVFISRRFWEYRGWFLDWRPGMAEVSVSLICALAYAAACFLLSASWRHLLKLCGEPNPDPRQCHRIYGRANIAKYLPGNVFHFAGRQVLGRRAGYSHLGIACASVYEILGMLVGSCAIAITGIILFELHDSGLTVLQFAAVTGVALVLVACIILFSGVLLRKRGIGPSQRSVFMVIGSLLLPYSYYIIFFLLSGGLLALLFIVVAAPIGIDFILQIVAAYSAAWVIGYITPGAPGGIGVREALLIVMLGNIIDEPQAILIALLFRLITIIGDMIYYALVTMAIPSRRNKSVR